MVIDSSFIEILHETRKRLCRMSYHLRQETGMPVQRLMRLIEADDGSMVQVRWRGLPPSEDRLEPL